MEDTIAVRFRTSIASREPRYAYEGGEVHHVPSELGRKWVASGVAEDVKPTRNAQPERATREPRSERAARRLR